MGVKNFKELNVWKLGKEIATDVYIATKSFPKEEQFGLVNQLRRASISITSNIAEGFSRFQKKDFKRFLQISYGSCSEVESQIEISFDLNYIDIKNKNSLIEKLNYEGRMLKKFIEKLN